MKEERIIFRNIRRMALIGIASMPKSEGSPLIELSDDCECWAVGYGQEENIGKIEELLGVVAEENECHPMASKLEDIVGCEAELIIRHKD